MGTFILHILGYFIIWAMIDYKRPKENRWDLISWDWFFVLIMLVIAVTLLRIK